jgi:transketolase
MRNAFAEEITDLGGSEQRLVLLCGDIGNRLFDKYKYRYPDRFLNCGVAEANMVSMAAGLALCGLKPVTYTIASFMTTRCLEQIRVDICYQNLPVTIVGVGSGLGYASLNATHHSCEDIAMMRAIPNMTVVCPGDPLETRLALRAAVNHTGPVYIRLGKKGEPIVHKEPPPFQIGKGIILRSGDDIGLVSTGTILPTVLETADELEKRGISTSVASLHTVKPLDEELLTDLFSTCALVVTIEEHSRLGGLGGSVAEWLTDQNPQKARLYRIGTRDQFMYEAGETDHARGFFGLTTGQIVEKVLGVYSQIVNLKV